VEDEEIIELYWMRDQQAIEETDRIYGRRLFWQAENILHCRQDSEESVNDTYLKAWETIPPQRPQYFFAYLAKICRYISLGRLERNNAAKRSALIVELTQEMEACIPDSYQQIQMEGREMGELFSMFLDSVSKENRRIFLYRYWYMKPIKEIVRQCGMSESNVKIRLFRLRNQLRKYLEEEGVQR